MIDETTSNMCDGLCTPVVGAWGKEKYKLVSKYCGVFSTSMKNKWDCRVYIDLFSGAGKAKIKDSEEIVYTSPLLSIDVKDRFDKYIFCEEDEEKIDALEKRVQCLSGSCNASFLHGDANQLTSNILNIIPTPGLNNKVISFCFVDPFNFNNFDFKTIETLSSIYVDFLVLIPTHMEGRRNEKILFEEGDNRIENFTGCCNWRELWQENEGGVKFDIFLTDIFGASMKKLGYVYTGVADTQLIRHHKKGLPLYRLAFFSRHKLAKKFWQDIKKSSYSQLRLCD